MIIIFDWDGTLCDSIDHIVEAMQDTADEMSLQSPTVDAVRDIVGLGLPEALARLFPSLDDDERAGVAAAYSRHFAAPHRGPSQLYSGAMDTLLALRERGMELAVATGKSRRGLDRVLASLELTDFFEVTRCADETHSKPHPRMLHEIMSARYKSAEEVLMIGDSEYDLEMATNAGVRSVGVSHGVHDSVRLAAHQPLAIVDSLPQLLDLAALS
jgi:phosphoglycolate phosphatase